jgi:holin-like protein
VGWRRHLRQRRVPQIALIFGFWLVGQALADWCRLPLPGGIVGLILVLVLLGSGWLRAGSLRRGANWYLAEMLLFFVPAVVAVLDHPEFLGVLGLKLMAAIILGTLVVMLATALSMDWCFRWMAASAADFAGGPAGASGCEAGSNHDAGS